MIYFKNARTIGWDAAIRGMRNPRQSWDNSDSFCEGSSIILGDNDKTLCKSLLDAGGSHSKWARFIIVTVDIIAPLYWWKQFDQYKVGTVTNSTSTMNSIMDSVISIDNFSLEDIPEQYAVRINNYIRLLNEVREAYEASGHNKIYFDLMIKLLPESYNQLRTVQLNYQVLSSIYKDRKNHKLKEWRDFCNWIDTLPYGTLLITGGN